MYLKDIPFPIIINEALEIVKEFSDQEGTQFVNGILDAASREFRPDENGPKARARKPLPDPTRDEPQASVEE
jgi:N utilization substance protein B